MKEPKVRLSRRTFLLAATAGTAATAAAVVGHQASEKTTPEADSKKSGGYQLTEHVRNYYRTAKI